MKQAVVYARVSSKDQAQEGYSIPAQLKLLREYAGERGFDVVREFVDVETAKRAGRSEFGAMIESLRRRGRSSRTILVEKTDRLYRNFRDYVTIDELGAEIHFVKEGVVISDDSLSDAKFMHGIRLLMAKKYIDNLSEEASKGMLEKAEQGTWPSVAPLGYINVSVGQRQGIALDPERAGLMRRMFEKYAEGNCSLDEIREWARSEGLTARRGRPPSKSTIERVLKNPFYIGRFTWKGKTYEGDHEHLISVELFQRAQMAFTKGNHHGRKNRRTFAYTGMIRCAQCGCLVTADIHKGKYIYYHCTRGRGPCDTGQIREDRLETLLGEVVRAVHIDDETIQWVIAALKESHKEEQVFHGEQVARLQGEVSRLQSQLDKAYDDRLAGLISED